MDTVLVSGDDVGVKIKGVTFVGLFVLKSPDMCFFMWINRIANNGGCSMQEN